MEVWSTPRPQEKANLAGGLVKSDGHRRKICLAKDTSEGTAGGQPSPAEPATTRAAAVLCWPPAHRYPPPQAALLYRRRRLLSPFWAKIPNVSLVG